MGGGGGLSCLNENSTAEVRTAVLRKTQVLCDVTLGRGVCSFPRLEGSYCIHFQSEGVEEDDGATILRNVGHHNLEPSSLIVGYSIGLNTSEYLSRI